MSKKLSEQDINIYRNMFEKIDSDKSGTIDRLELFTMMKELTDGRITENDVDQMMKDADMDGDGRIDFEEFVKQMEKF
ncbi:hypothetical protein C9374_014417 [Naegleria lovaniensis]|uniref:EF-hand domain-containing protein n=1 Tax=Naegleria lovaniensis TaxID=51637 RepID=A0AA88GUB2_NAELO|nr:uncharacterized protein C9374_014417 [Naegleria lovaniensis]KAG2389017.1 hypothetical protein C9374_014417 [Naegleria lovaniensis]